jgi:hypothetical protein
MNFNHLNQLVHTFNWHSPSWDLFIVLFWLVASVMYAFAAGRGRILSVLVSIYIAKLLVLEAPFLSQNISKHFNITVLYMQQLATFAVLFLVLFMFLARYAFKTAADTRHLTSFVFSLVFAFLQIGLLINIVLGFLPDAIRATFSPLIKLVFIDGQANFIWLLLPIVYLIALGRFVSERTEI